jgi:HAD superfamily hydrolase (TIGR01509 family)
MIEAIIFDMDGVLIDSEPFWIQAEMEILSTVGVDLTPELCTHTTGLRIEATVQYWYERIPWKEKSREHVALEIQERVAELIRRNAHPCDGVDKIIALASENRLPMGLCSSSPYVIVRQVVDQLELLDNLSVVYSTENEPFGKPHPGGYMTTATRLEVPCARCLVFEDSLNGAISAKAAGMKVVAVPQGGQRMSTRFDFCDAKISSLIDFNEEALCRFRSLG